MRDHVLLSNIYGDVKGTMSKKKAHELGVMHKAFSVFIFNDNKEMLLQRRALDKYHSGGLWTNSCCSHQMINETTLEAGVRRLKEETGIVSELKEIFTIIYRVEFSNGLIENEYDHILMGFSNDLSPKFNREEIMDIRWSNIDDIRYDMKLNYDDYTYWFKLLIEKYYSKIKAFI